MNEWILVVDDDAGNLKTASHILLTDGMRASCVRSGEDALRFLDGGRRPDLILLDIHMPGMDGFETLRHIRANAETAGIPVVFLTADEDSGAETHALNAGAKDFIKKPFVPEVLLTRVHHIIDLTRLQNELENQVREKTEAVIRQQEEMNRLSIHIVMTLAGAVDAKDEYTNGHSRRVAEYSREIARRFGYDEQRAQNVYLIGLLHDIGKIGIPDSIINKPDSLSDEEIEITRKHPEMGRRILENIPEFPELAIGAHWHHERYDGTGYPDGISGTDIPEEARIIAVADTYDAMTSRRSYRDVLPQETARAEIAAGSGTQFDPVFAEIMLQMIDEDTDYIMRQK
ncbi:MAG: response regulator [Oscillospiraceae bacterium]|nr:response regulator [Oscillospiraceae bacterium]